MALNEPIVISSDSEAEGNEFQNEINIEDVFNKFIKLCTTTMNQVLITKNGQKTQPDNSAKERMIKTMKRRHFKYNSTLMFNKKYRKKLNLFITKLQNGDTDVYVFINDFLSFTENLSQGKKRRIKTILVENIPPKKPCTETTSSDYDVTNKQVDDNKDEELIVENNVNNDDITNKNNEKIIKNCDETITNNNEDNNHDTTKNNENKSIPHCSTDNANCLNNKEEKISQKRKRKIKKMENYLKKLNMEIKRLEAHEMSMEELEEEDSTYIQIGLLKKRVMKVFNEICDMKKCCRLLGRVTEQKIEVTSSEFPEINKKVERYIRKVGKFPDYSEVLFLVTQGNNRHNFNLSKPNIKSLAEKIFIEIGEKMKKRRQTDLKFNSGSFLTDDADTTLDPADNDAELNEQLKKNSKLASEKLSKILKEFANKELEIKKEKEEKDGKLKNDENKPENEDKVDNDDTSENNGNEDKVENDEDCGSLPPPSDESADEESEDLEIIELSSD